MDLVFDFYIPRAGMHWCIKYVVALFIQKETEDAENTKYHVNDLDRYSSYYRLGIINFCHSTGNGGGARRRYFLLSVFRTGIVK